MSIGAQVQWVHGELSYGVELQWAGMSYRDGRDARV
jgi:hypothetical protein